MNPQFDALRAKFNSMSLSGKKDFIDKLKAMPNNSPAHRNFVMECTDRYQTELNGGRATYTRSSGETYNRNGGDNINELDRSLIRHPAIPPYLPLNALSTSGRLMRE